MAEILKTEGLCRYFGAVTAAENISVSIAAGEVVGVIGANGAGKTTFINMVTGYLPPSAGNIWFNGETIRGLGPRKLTRQGLARSFQIPQLFLELTVMENLLIALNAAENPALSLIQPFRTSGRESQAERILEQMGLGRYRDENVTAMPQGARKLLDIAMAMIGKPRMLLLDEPTSGVSVDEKYPLMDTVMDVVQQQNLTVLFVEHDMEIVRRYVSRILAFAHGEIIGDGTPDEVMNDERVQEQITGRHQGAAAAGGA
ncbi:MAG: ABC transporter ATP-binding protein [Ectothiorhodospiraceae bacterium]|nr:ABC transporter ATP-binding protein [Ectothiorhodospiraceae bacterium]MCH8504466.1 ABC transporter ATP-binding protein [Ectothiorhodospiraceae bacterium]